MIRPFKILATFVKASKQQLTTNRWSVLKSEGWRVLTKPLRPSIPLHIPKPFQGNFLPFSASNPIWKCPFFRQQLKPAIGARTFSTLVISHESNDAITKKSVIEKLDKYLLADTHPKGKEKARWFKGALGYTKENASKLAKQIVFNPETAAQTAVTQHGIKYNQIIPIRGANGKTIEVTFAWIKNNDGIVRLVTATPFKRQK